MVVNVALSRLFLLSPARFGTAAYTCELPEEEG